MVTNLLFGLNLVAAAALILLAWRSMRLRPMVAFHAAGLAAAVILFATMTWHSSSEVESDRLPALFVFRIVVSAAAYLPFVAFLVATYVRALGGIAADDTSTAEIRLEDARQALRLGHAERAVKMVRELLDADPGNTEALTIMAEIHLKRGHYEKAVGSYRLAMAHSRSDEEFAQFVFTVTVILNEHLGDAQQAARELDLIRQRMPDTPQARKAQKWIYRILDEAARET
jgi:tetratricopeptide (TPR) repeat protein